MSDETTITFQWEQVAGLFTSGNESDTLDVSAFLDPDEDARHVIVGIGGHVHDTSVDMIELVTSKIKHSGVLGDPTSLKFGNQSKTSEVLCTLDENQIAVGAGFRASGTTMSVVKIYYRNWDPKTGLLVGDVLSKTAKADNYTGSGDPEQSWYADDNIFLDQSTSATVLTGIGATAIAHNDKANIDLMVFQTGCLTMSPQPPEAKDAIQTYYQLDDIFKRQCMAVDEQSTIAVTDYQRCANLSENAYTANKPDSFFTEGFKTLDGSSSRYDSRNAWASANGYNLINDPERGCVAIWGDAYFDSVQGNTRFISFRGTELFNLYDIFADLSWIPGSSASTWAYPMMQALISQKTYAVWKDWGVLSTMTKVHAGFYNAYYTIRDFVIIAIGDFLANGGDVFITGHSLGAAIAIIAAMDIRSTYGQANGAGNINIVTFGAPRVGDQTFATLYNQTFHAAEDYVTSRSISFQDANDWVPYAPANGFEDGAPSDSGIFANVGLPVVLSSGHYFPMDHFIKNYSNNLVQWSPPEISTNTLTPETPINSLNVRIYTSSSWWSGTDAEVYCSIAGNTFGPLSSDIDDFEAGSDHPYNLIDNNAPINLQTVNELFAQLLYFWIQPSSWDWDSDWKLEKVTVFVNNVELSTLIYNEWIDDNTQNAHGRVIAYRLPES